MDEFLLDPAFVATSHAVIDLPLCDVRLQEDARYPWLVLIPRLPGLRELEDLSPTDRVRLMEETILAGAAVRAVAKTLGLRVEKLNVCALGNVTAQLHVHIVGRRRDDPAWPGPVWGHSAATPYDDAIRAAAVAAAAQTLAS